MVVWVSRIIFVGVLLLFSGLYSSNQDFNTVKYQKVMAQNDYVCGSFRDYKFIARLNNRKVVKIYNNDKVLLFNNGKWVNGGASEDVQALFEIEGSLGTAWK